MPETTMSPKDALAIVENVRKSVTMTGADHDQLTEAIAVLKALVPNADDEA